MSSPLMDRARQAAEPASTPNADAVPAPDFHDYGPSVGLAALVELDEPTSDDPEKVPVAVAWARVMRDVQGVAKKGLYNQGGTRYNFRGVDAMISAFAPAVRRHGVMVIPTKVTPSHAPATSSKGSAMRETTSVVAFRIYGPMGDFIEGEAEGESLDVSDKGTAKAQSIALRAFLIAAGMVPTDEPDPDTSHIERGERPTVKPTDYRDEVVNPRTSAGRLRQIRKEIQEHRVGGALVVNEVGDEEQLLKLVDRIGSERAAAEAQTAQVPS